ncbi:unnamed protein product [Schistosoma spindalis]|nr:unnamed protein product [Schistosoma spindale]
MMMKLAFNNVSAVTCQNKTYCIFDSFGDPYVLIGLILILIGLVLGLLIIFIKKLHSASPMNSFIIVITMIIMILGAGLLSSCSKWYEILIPASLATIFAILAILSGVKLHDSRRKWKVLLFATGGVFLVTGFILLVIGLILKKVIILTTHYLEIRRKQEQFSILYNVFVWFIEYIVLVINLQLALNSLIDCNSKNGKTE